MDTLVFFLVVGLILLIGVLISVQINGPDGFVRGRVHRIRRLRRVRAVPGAVSTIQGVPGAVSTLPVDTVVEEIIDEVEPAELVEEEA